MTVSFIDGDTRVSGENHRPVTSHWQTLSNNVVSSTPRLSVVRTHNVSGCRQWDNWNIVENDIKHHNQLFSIRQSKIKKIWNDYRKEIKYEIFGPERFLYYTTLVDVDSDFTDSCKFIFHTITTTTAPNCLSVYQIKIKYYCKLRLHF
jgi:hypothetical protein